MMRHARIILVALGIPLLLAGLPHALAYWRPFVPAALNRASYRDALPNAYALGLQDQRLAPVRALLDAWYPMASFVVEDRLDSLVARLLPERDSASTLRRNDGGRAGASVLGGDRMRPPVVAEGPLPDHRHVLFGYNPYVMSSLGDSEIIEVFKDSKTLFHTLVVVIPADRSVTEAVVYQLDDHLVIAPASAAPSSLSPISHARQALNEWIALVALFALGLLVLSFLGFRSVMASCLALPLTLGDFAVLFILLRLLAPIASMLYLLDLVRIYLAVGMIALFFLVARRPALRPHLAVASSIIGMVVLVQYLRPLMVLSFDSLVLINFNRSVAEAYEKVFPLPFSAMQSFSLWTGGYTMRSLTLLFGANLIALVSAWSFTGIRRSARRVPVALLAALIPLMLFSHFMGLTLLVFVNTHVFVAILLAGFAWCVAEHLRGGGDPPLVVAAAFLLVYSLTRIEGCLVGAWLAFITIPHIEESPSSRLFGFLVSGLLVVQPLLLTLFTPAGQVGSDYYLVQSVLALAPAVAAIFWSSAAVRRRAARVESVLFLGPLAFFIGYLLVVSNVDFEIGIPNVFLSLFVSNLWGNLWLWALLPIFLHLFAGRSGSEAETRLMNLLLRYFFSVLLITIATQGFRDYFVVKWTDSFNRMLFHYLPWITVFSVLSAARFIRGDTNDKP